MLLETLSEAERVWSKGYTINSVMPASVSRHIQTRLLSLELDFAWIRDLSHPETLRARPCPLIARVNSRSYNL